DGAAQRPRSPQPRAPVPRGLSGHHHDGVRYAGGALRGGRARRRRLPREAAEPAGPARAGARAHRVARSMAAATKLLVVDDEAGMRKSLAIMLRREGYTVAESASGKDAL